MSVSFYAAMDAASLLFSRHELDPDRKDVHFMLALHTAVTTAYYKVPSGALGVYRAFGDVNLYPNNGTIIQPACRGESIFPVQLMQHQTGRGSSDSFFVESPKSSELPFDNRAHDSVHFREQQFLLFTCPRLHLFHKDGERV